MGTYTATADALSNANYELAAKSGATTTFTIYAGADGYDVFFAKCGRNIACKKVATVKAGKKLQWTQKRLKKRTSYKAYVKAYVMDGGKKKYLKKSPTTHAYSSGGTKRYTNPKKVTVKKSSVSLNVGKTHKVEASVTKLNKRKALLPASHVRKLRYVSSNKSIATVNKSGKVTAKRTGTCKVYVLSANGLKKAVKVTVTKVS